MQLPSSSFVCAVLIELPHHDDGWQPEAQAWLQVTLVSVQCHAGAPASETQAGTGNLP